VTTLRRNCAHSGLPLEAGVSAPKMKDQHGADDGPDRKRARSGMDAMMTIRKIGIAALEAAVAEAH
jgi:hypothetical protein